MGQVAQPLVVHGLEDVALFEAAGALPLAGQAQPTRLPFAAIANAAARQFGHPHLQPFQAASALARRGGVGRAGGVLYRHGAGIDGRQLGNGLVPEKIGR